MIEVKTTGELKGNILFFKNTPTWKEQLAIYAERVGIIPNYYYIQKIEGGVVLVSYPVKKTLLTLDGSIKYDLQE